MITISPLQVTLFLNILGNVFVTHMEVFQLGKYKGGIVDLW